MPRISWTKPKVNYLSAMLRAYQKERRMTADQIGRLVGGVKGEAVRKQIAKPADMWRIRDLKLYCDALGIPYEDAVLAAVQK